MQNTTQYSSYRKNNYLKPTSKSIFTGVSNAVLFALSGCGGGTNTSSSNQNTDATKADAPFFPSQYTPPGANFEPPLNDDPYYERLKLNYTDPYWVSALEMDKSSEHIAAVSEIYEKTLFFNFPETLPEYEHFDINGWEPASEQMRTATRKILSSLEHVLDVTFIESDEPYGLNVMAIGISNQETTSGFSYFPNEYYELGMDVFISKSFSEPSYTTNTITNYDYEVLVHEIGHALGLKHPFEADGKNGSVLRGYEDNTFNTVMSYDDSPITFIGTVRHLDWMTLTKFYGVKPTYNSGDDIYEFSRLGGTFIVDGAGLDTINAADTSSDVTVDLRPGAHSHLGSKSSYITSANQLTISHGSDIENVETGSGDDTVIATALGNLIATGAGNDTIFAGGGADVIRSGTGSDRIDLSEAIQAVDTIAVDASLFDLGFDTIFGFVQGAAGDVLDLSGILETGADFFPLVAAGAAPVANFSDGVLRVVGDALATSTDLVSALGVGGALSPLSMSDGARSIIVSAASQDTGEAQSVFYAQGSSAVIQISQLALLQGNALDIDQWHASNFGMIA